MKQLQKTVYNTVDEAVLKYFKDEQRKKDAERMKRAPEDSFWRPSSMGLCKRSHFFSRKNYKQDIGLERDDFVTELGNMTHEYVAKACKETGILICSEKTIVDKENSLRGRFDNLVLLKRGVAMVDVKSQRPEAFFKRSKEEESKRVKHHQKVQLATYDYLANKYLRHIYPELVNKDTGKVVDYCIIYYVDRGGGCRDEIPLRFSDSFIKKYVLDELDELNNYYNKNIIPPSEGWGTWQCKYCNYKKTCIELRAKSKEQAKAKDLKSKANNKHKKKQKNESTNIRTTNKRQGRLL